MKLEKLLTEVASLPRIRGTDGLYCEISADDLAQLVAIAEAADKVVPHLPKPDKFMYAYSDHMKTTMDLRKALGMK